MSTILISGGTGLLGKAICKKLLRAGHLIHILTRQEKKSGHPQITYFKWDLSKGYIEEDAFKNIEGIVHLAGTSVAEGRWNKKRKQDILNSRVESAELLKAYLLKVNIKLDFFVSASGVAYYGSKTSNSIFTEMDQLGSGFLADVTQHWESAADSFSNASNRVVKIRISTVLAKDGGAFPKLAMPVKWGLGAALGAGKQWFPWIHIDDLAQLFVWVIEEKKSGIYNGCAPEEATNYSFTKALAKKLGRPFIIPPIPSFVLRLILGTEMANEMILNGSRISAQKSLEEGFVFRFPKVENAISDLLF
ncbi:MAG: TIGR01777 family oxidoreductase [Flavobacteriales bacterium]|nr:TIGR01777 family oxidoreductase [Flavobacteriales bacterium]